MLKAAQKRAAFFVFKHLLGYFYYRILQDTAGYFMTAILKHTAMFAVTIMMAAAR